MFLANVEKYCQKLILSTFQSKKHYILDSSKSAVFRSVVSVLPFQNQLLVRTKYDQVKELTLASIPEVVQHDYKAQTSKYDFESQTWNDKFYEAYTSHRRAVVLSMWKNRKRSILVATRSWIIAINSCNVATEPERQQLINDALKLLVTYGKPNHPYDITHWMVLAPELAPLIFRSSPLRIYEFLDGYFNNFIPLQDEIVLQACLSKLKRVETVNESINILNRFQTKYQLTMTDDVVYKLYFRLTKSSFPSDKQLMMFLIQIFNNHYELTGTWGSQTLEAVTSAYEDGLLPHDFISNVMASHAPLNSMSTGLLQKLFRVMELNKMDLRYQLIFAFRVLQHRKDLNVMIYSRIVKLFLASGIVPQALSLCASVIKNPTKGDGIDLLLRQVINYRSHPLVIKWLASYFATHSLYEKVLHLQLINETTLLAILEDFFNNSYTHAAADLLHFLYVTQEFWSPSYTTLLMRQYLEQEISLLTSADEAGEDVSTRTKFVHHFASFFESDPTGSNLTATSCGPIITDILNYYNHFSKNTTTFDINLKISAVDLGNILEHLPEISVQYINDCWDNLQFLGDDNKLKRELIVLNELNRTQKWDQAVQFAKSIVNNYIENSSEPLYWNTILPLAVSVILRQTPIDKGFPDDLTKLVDKFSQHNMPWPPALIALLVRFNLERDCENCVSSFISQMQVFPGCKFDFHQLNYIMSGLNWSSAPTGFLDKYLDSPFHMSQDFISFIAHLYANSMISTLPLETIFTKLSDMKLSAIQQEVWIYILVGHIQNGLIAEATLILDVLSSQNIESFKLKALFYYCAVQIKLSNQQHKDIIQFLQIAKKDYVSFISSPLYSTNNENTTTIFASENITNSNTTLIFEKFWNLVYETAQTDPFIKAWLTSNAENLPKELYTNDHVELKSKHSPSPTL